MLHGPSGKCVFGRPIGRDGQSRAKREPIPCGASEMTSPAAPTADLVAADLAKLINPGLRSPRADLAVLPGLALVQADIRRGGRSVPDAIETVVNRGLAAMGADPPGPGLPRLAADPVKALRAALALRPGSERVKSKTRRTAAAQALGLLSGDGWRAHHEKPLLRDLADAICSLEADSPEAGPADSVSGAGPGAGLTGAGAGAGPRMAGLPGAGAGTGAAGIVQFYSDFVDIESDWDALFAASSTLDVAVMYGATWRNTYRKHLHVLADRPGGRVRVVLPNPSPDSPHADLYAHTLRVRPEDFRRKVTEAIEDFATIGPRRHVEVYLTTAMFRHAIYLFTHQAVLALYALCSERIPTPALRASDGGLLSFMRLDFDRLLEQSDRIT
jgi:hypothetical protein